LIIERGCGNHLVITDSRRRWKMKIGVSTAAVLAALVWFSGIGAADSIFRGKVILISNGMYTIKTDSDQGFAGSRETFVVDPKVTKQTGEIKVGTMVEAEVNPNGMAYWIKAIDEGKNDTKKSANK
jgi:hypothetical protein